MNHSLLPHSVEAEKSVLGAVLSSKTAFESVMSIIRPDSFYADAHQKIYTAALELFARGVKVDTTTIIDRLKKKKELADVGGGYYLTGLVESIPTTANAAGYADIVKEKSKLRQIIAIAHEHSDRAYNDSEDADQVLESLESSIIGITRTDKQYQVANLSELIFSVIDSAETAMKTGGPKWGLKTGLTDLDNLTLGQHPGDVTLIAARPGMGKTALALTIAKNIAKDCHSAGVFSLEMSDARLVERLVFSEAKVDGMKVRHGKIDKAELDHIVQRGMSLAEIPLHIIDTTDCDWVKIRTFIRRYVSKANLEIVILDYLQLVEMRSKTENRQQEISTISRQIKLLARELNIPIIALSQLSRALESRSNKRPLLSDLRESGSLEQDADNVYFIYRPAVYDPDTEDPGIAEINIAKQRNGPTQTVELTFLKESTSFENHIPTNMFE